MSRVSSPRHRRGLIVAVALAVALAVAGCGKTSNGSGGAAGAGSDAAPSGGTAPTTKKLVINSFGGDWGDAIQKGFIDEFERQTGIKVQLLSTADPAKSKLAIQQGNTPPEDILDYDFGTAASLQQANLLAPIDYGSFDQTSLAQVPSVFKQRYAVGWGGFPIAICYDKKRFASAPPETWADFWNVSKFPGKRGMLAWPVQPQPEFGLLADGVAVDQLYPIDINKAMAKLKQLQPHVAKFADSPATLQQQLVDGTISMAACYGHRAEKLIQDGASNVGISYKQARLIDDYFTVWKNAPNRANAMKFLSFILSARQQARWAEIGFTTPVNSEAVKHLPAATRTKLPPPGEAFASNDSYYTQQTGGKTNQQRIIDAWNNQVGQ
jgi:putative spermidine/putrescine transport system substrate-binding protein